MTRAIGCDLSRYNISFDPNLATGAIDFAIQKATEGTSYVDLKYEEIWQGVQKITVRGAYHYQRSDMSWKAQADHFLDTAARHDYHLYALDLEEVGNTYSDTFFADAKRILDYWRAVTDKKVVLYTNGSTYNQFYLALLKLYGEAGVSWLDGTSLWIASPTLAGAPYLPKYRTNQDWFIHQYSWTGLPSRWGTGGTRVDENVFCGDVNLLWSSLHMTPESGNTETEAGMSQWYRVNADALNIRQGPGASYQDIGDLLRNDQIETSEVLGGWLHIVSISRNGGPWLMPPDPLNSWCSGAYCVAIDPPVTPPPPPSEGLFVSVDAVITANIGGKVYVGNVLMDNVELVER